jgi:hypothetical protein
MTIVTTCDNCGGRGVCTEAQTIAAREALYAAEFAKLQSHLEGEIARLGGFLERSRDHARILEGQVRRLVDEKVIMQRALDLATRRMLVWAEEQIQQVRSYRQDAQLWPLVTAELTHDERRLVSESMPNDH